jgi:amino acid adenylation domain-containing protein
MNDRLFPLSFSQRMFWFLDRIERDTPACNLPRVVKIGGRLDMGALSGAFRALLRRHDALRTIFVEHDGELFQRVLENAEIDLPVRDLSSLPPRQREAETLRIASEEARKPFDLEHAPLFRLSSLRLAPEEHVLVLVMHHIITDGWSMSILFEEIAKYYGQLAVGNQLQTVALPLQYTGFAVQQQEHLTEDVLHNDVEYWRDQLRGCPSLLEMPGDHPRPPVQSHHGSIESFVIGEPITRQIKELCNREGVTLFMGLLAAFQVLLSRYTGKEDICVGTPIAGRFDPDLAPLIGCFVNTLVLRGDLSGNPSFRQLLRRVRAISLDAYAHQELPFAQLLAKLKCERTRSHTPLFQTMLILQSGPRQVVHLPGLLIKELELDSGLAKFDLTLEIIEKEGGLYCQIEYSSDLFERPTIQRLASHFRTLVSSAIEDPACPIARLNLLEATERKQIISDWNATFTEYRRDLTLAAAFEDQVSRTPDIIGLFEDTRAVTFRELDRRANQVANELIAKGVQPETPVGLYMKRSIDALAALLGALKAGCPYVPLDTSQPKGRLDLLVRTCRCPVVLTCRALQGDLPDAMDCILLDADAALWVNQSGVSPAPRPAGGVAYIIFTSGSTGVPKAVAGTHRATMNRLEWMYQAYPFSADEVCCQKTALGFVDSICEIFGPLCRGIPNVLVPEDVVIEPELLLNLLARRRVTRIVLVPALLHALLEHAPNLGARVPTLRQWTVSGEYLPVALTKRFRAAFPDAMLLNLYGSSEVAGDATYYEVRELPGEVHAIPIGKPIANTRVYVLDECKQPAPIGVPGMLHIAGDCLSQGYWGRPDLTSERFAPDPFDAYRGPLFETGDRARWLPDGNIEYLGRLDTQIKIRGFRVDLGDIEANLMAHPDVRHAAVSLASPSPESQRLIAYVVGRDRPGPRPEKLRDFLRSRLPEYTVPAFYVEMADLPLLPSGKVDRNALPEPPVGVVGEWGQIKPRNDIENQLAAIWREVLRVEEFGVTDNFFDLGGDSLLAMQVLARVRRSFRVEVSIASLFDGPSIEALGQEIEKAKASGVVAKIPAIIPRPRPTTSMDALSAELRKLSSEQIETLLQQIRRGESAPEHQGPPEPPAGVTC